MEPPGPARLGGRRPAAAAGGADGRERRLDRKALACYSVLLPSTGEVWLRFLDGRPVSAVTTAFLGRCCEQAAAQGTRALLESGFLEVDSAGRDMRMLSGAPRSGQFCREALLGERKADLVVGLWDGRIRPIECKVSNSSTNSVKRLNNDAAIKA